LLYWAELILGNSAPREQKGTRAQLSEHAVAHHDVDDYNLDNYDTAARAATPAASNGPSYSSRVAD